MARTSLSWDDDTLCCWVQSSRWISREMMWCKLQAFPCCYAFIREHICSICDQCSSMECSELNNILFGHVMATTIHSEVMEKRGHLSKNRERITGWYYMKGIRYVLIMTWLYHTSRFFQICRTTFLFLHNTGIKKYYTVTRAYVKNGLEAVSHGNKNRLPSHAFATSVKLWPSLPTMWRHTIQLPARILGYDLQLLPSQTSKHSVWDSYVKSYATLTFRLAEHFVRYGANTNHTW